jgi:hypothetical protein
LQRGERQRAPFALRPRFRRVAEDAEDPRLQGRAALEAVEPIEDADPGLLDDLLRDRPARDPDLRDTQQGRVVQEDELLERRLVPGPQRLQELRLVQRERRLHA